MPAIEPAGSAGLDPEAALAYIQGAPDAIISVSHDGTIEMANAKAAEMLGYEVGELVGEPIELLVPTKSQDVHRAHRLRYESDPKVRPMGESDTRLFARRADKSVLPVEISLSPVQVRGTRMVMAVIRDISLRDRREQLLRSLALIRKSALNEDPINTVLQLVADSIPASLKTMYGVIAVPNSDGQLRARAISGSPPSSATRRQTVTQAGTEIHQALDSGEARVIDSPGSGLILPAGGEPRLADLGPMVIVPLISAGAPQGVLIAAREADGDQFTEAELGAAQSLASEAAVSFVLAQARNDRRQMLLTEDRERIARDLHDVVIQRLFATGMRLQAGTGVSSLREERMHETIQDLDETIASIRSTIYRLTEPQHTPAGEIQRLIDRHNAVGKNSVTLDLSGDMGNIQTDRLDQLLPTLNELLSNVERHAEASLAKVSIFSGRQNLVIRVEDDGVGMPTGDHAGFGLRSLARRAESLNGSLSYGPGPDGIGTVVEWAVPLEQAPGS